MLEKKNILLKLSGSYQTTSEQQVFTTDILNSNLMYVKIH